MPDPVQQRPGAYDVDSRTTFVELLKQPAFYVLFVGIIGQVLISEFGPGWHYYHAAHVAVGITDALAGLRIAMWQPPRVPWSNEKRIANGLPPLDGNGPIVPPIPPRQDDKP